MNNYPHTQWPGWAYNEVTDPYSGYTQLSNYSTYLADSMETYQSQHHHHLVHHHQMSRTTESKPRLSKEEVEVLEAEFQKNHKPSSSTKKALAESMRVDNARINNWFQNRRAREKKENNIREYEARQKLEKEKLEAQAGGRLIPERNSDLVPSSAPFPSSQAPSSSRDSTEIPDFQQTTPDLSHDQLPTRLDEEDLTTKAHDIPVSGNAPLPGSQAFFDGDFSHIQSAGLADEAPSPLSGEDHLSPDVELSLRSPANIDLAARRNRRAPALAINPPRSYSTGIVSSGLEVGRRGELGGSMRRVASATGSARVAKPVLGGRSPLLRRNRSPVTAIPRGSHAPPTPDTPILTNQPTKNDIGGISITDLAVHDPTFRTPPTTPGVMDNTYNIDSVYDLSLSEASLVTPSIPNFQTEFEVPSMALPVPNYVTSTGGGCSSRPDSPSFSSRMGPAYYGYTGGNAEYNWSDGSESEGAYSIQQSQNAHFMHLNQPNFGILER